MTVIVNQQVLLERAADAARRAIWGNIPADLANDYTRFRALAEAWGNAAARAVLAELVRDLTRPWTPDRVTETGTWVTVKRACSGCGRLLGDITDAEMNAAVEDDPLPDTTAECGCRS
jgi:hypothetical protein